MGSSEGSSVLERQKVFVDGRWTDSRGSDFIAVTDPATEQEIARVVSGTAEDVDRAARAAAAALPEWSRTPLAVRADLLRRLADLIDERAHEITTAIVHEVGQPWAQAAKLQVASPADNLRVIADCAAEVVWEERLGETVVRREPAGVVGAITPWNVPLLMIARKVGAALVAGCTVVLKGSEVAPASAFFFAELAERAGVPAGVFNLVSGTGPVVGEAISSHPAIDMVSLTGSVRAGQSVMRAAAGTLKRVSLELGGKSANIVLDGVDLDRAIGDGIADAFRNSGQACGGLTRVLVPRVHLAEAEEVAAQTAAGYVLGDPFDSATTLGPVTTAAQRERVRSFIRSGPDEGARLIAGGAEAPAGLDRGYFVQPTVFTSSNDTRLAREEIFGPVVVIVPFEDEADAIAIANDSPYGLAGGVWSPDVEHARAVATKLRTGRVRINGAPVSQRSPHGGFGLSGIGREWGRFGVEEFLEYQAVG